MNDSICCRICYEGDEEGYLIAPCDCDGSLRYIHKSCLMRWLINGSEVRERICHLCKGAYRGLDVLDRIEAIPRCDTWSEFLLLNPVVLIFAYEYLLMSIGLSSRCVHALVYTSFLGLFLTRFAVKNRTLYFYEWCTTWYFVPVGYYFLWKSYTEFGFLQCAYLADLWLTLYWHGHMRILAAINRELLAIH